MPRPSGGAQVIAYQALPTESDGAMCDFVPASASTTLMAALQQDQMPSDGVASRKPVRMIKDNFSSYSSVAVDLKNDEVVMTDESLFNILTFNRLENTSATATMSEPKRIIGGVASWVISMRPLYRSRQRRHLRCQQRYRRQAGHLLAEGQRQRCARPDYQYPAHHLWHRRRRATPGAIPDRSGSGGGFGLQEKGCAGRVAHSAHPGTPRRCWPILTASLWIRSGTCSSSPILEIVASMPRTPGAPQTVLDLGFQTRRTG